jgi:uncharacterized membrane protein YhaH (DUF805 family)/DNA-directed RNA polymerase subunit RPC12/RpoP
MNEIKGESSLVKCFFCGEKIASESVFCPYCGVRLKKNKKISCDKCGREVEADGLFCNYCGNRLSAISNNDLKLEQGNVKRGLFKGRIGRRVYFFGSIFSWLFLVLFIFIIAFLDLLSNETITAIYLFFFYLLFVYIIIINFSLAIRRLHDINKSGWYLLLSFIPLLGSVFSLYILFKKGDKKINNYGPPPKAKGFGINEIKEVYLGSFGY